MKLQWRGQHYKDLLWRCATATTMQLFKKNMEELKGAKKEVYDWLTKIPPQHWARSHFSGMFGCIVLLIEIYWFVIKVIFLFKFQVDLIVMFC